MFKKLKDIDGNFDVLTVRCTNAELERRDGHTLFSMNISEEMEVLISSKERREHRRQFSPWLDKQLQLWNEQKSHTLKIKVATKDHPLEVITGDTGLFLNIEGIRYRYSTFRDIEPIGWIIPGGCPRSKAELFDPRNLSDRECAEEALIADCNGNVYNFSKFTDAVNKNIDDWQKKGINFGDIISVPVKELTPYQFDADVIIIKTDNTEKEINGLYVDINQISMTASANRYLEVVLPIKFGELRLFDGERGLNNSLLNRPIRLQDAKENTKAMFWSGFSLMPNNWSGPKMSKKATFIL